VSPTIQLFINLGGMVLVIVLANLAESRRGLRGPLHGILVGVNLLFLYRYFATPFDSSISEANIQLGAVLAVFFVVMGLLVLVRSVRLSLARFFPRRALSTSNGQTVVTGFDPDSMVHMTALVCCLYLVANTTLDFVVLGGLAGLAQNFDGITISDFWTQAAILIGFSIVGVGLGVRRRGGSVLQRLGLRAPTMVELTMALIMAFFLYGLAFIVGIIWQIVTPREVFEQQTILSQEIGNSVNTLTIGFMLAASAALGEEIAFRGALQPIFGLLPTTILFAAIHTQYVLTPASLLIFFVGLGFGWLRYRYNTTTSIVAHFLYDFMLVALSVFARYAQDVLTPTGVSHIFHGLVR
jgi:uncharacterized protein